MSIDMERYYDKKTECMSSGEMRSLQSERLVKLVKYVYENNKVYHDKMDNEKVKPSDIKSIDDIVKLPFTTKQDLRGNYPFGMFTAPKKDIVRLHASSGTSGKLTVVGYTKNDLEIWSECAARALVSAGVTEDSIVHIAYGYGLFTGGLGIHYGAEKLGAIAVPASSGNTTRQISLMSDFGADTLCCTPSYALYLGEALESSENKLLNLKIGIFGAEPWSDTMRKKIEKILGIKAYDIYGLSEIAGPGVAMECSEQSGCHIYEDHFYPEILDTKTLEPLNYGEKGELVFTTLTKEGIPLIRYRTRDLTKLKKETCSCGRTLVKMGRIIGRSDDMLIIRGVNVFPSQIETVLLNFSEGILPHYEIFIDRINSTDYFEIRVEMNESIFSDEVKKIEIIKKQIESELQSALGISVNVKLVAPNSLPRYEGKAKRIIDNRKY